MPPNPNAPDGSADEDAEQLIALYDAESESTSDESSTVDILLVAIYWAKRRTDPQEPFLTKVSSYLQKAFTRRVAT